MQKHHFAQSHNNEHKANTTVAESAQDGALSQSLCWPMPPAMVIRRGYRSPRDEAQQSPQPQSPQPQPQQRPQAAGQQPQIDLQVEPFEALTLEDALARDAAWRSVLDANASLLRAQRGR